MQWAALIAWVVTAAGGFVLLAIWLSRGGMRQASAAGAVLNELSDVIADAALYLPFALIPGVNGMLVVLVVIAGIVAEMAGALGPLVKALERRYPYRGAAAQAPAQG